MFFGAVSVGGTLAVTGDTDVTNFSASGTLDVAGNGSVGGTLAVTGDTDVTNFSANGTLDVSGNASVGGTFQITGNTTASNVSADGTLNISGNGSVGGTFNVEGDLKNSAGNLTVLPTTYILEVKGGGSTDGAIKLNCSSNSHGQTIKAQDHSAGVTNTMLLPRGDSSVLVSEVATQTLTNKTLGATSVDGTFNISGNASVGGTFNVTGSAGLAGNVNIGNATADETTIASQVAFQNNLRERTSINTTSATGTINFDILSHNVELRTSDAAANWELNFRGNSGTTFASTVDVGQTTSFAFESSQGGTAYYLTAIEIDGTTASPVYWQGGTAPSEGNVSGVDSYLINITRRADGGSGTAQYTVLASQTQFGKVDY